MDPLPSPRSPSQVIRDMITVAVRDATDEQLLELRERIGPWLLEMTLDAALAGGGAAAVPPVGTEVPTDPAPPRAARREPKYCNDVERIGAALLGLSEMVEAAGEEWTTPGVFRVMNWTRRKNAEKVVSPKMLDFSARRMTLSKLTEIEEAVARWTADQHTNNEVSTDDTR